MLKMQNSSGLTRFEVRKAQLANRPAPRIAKFHLAILPTLLLGAGIVAVSAGAAGVLAASLIALFLVLAVGGAHIGIHRWAQALDNGDQAVMVIREGLMRQATVADLVVGDTVLLAPGATAPVDLTAIDGRVVNKTTARLARLLHVAVPADMTVAGSTVLAATQAQVVAIGADRWALRVVLACLTEEATASHHLGLRLVQLLHGWLAAATPAPSARHVRPIDNDNNDLLQASTATRMTLVGNIRQAAQEAAFRYNQDPVS